MFPKTQLQTYLSVPNELFNKRSSLLKLYVFQTSIAIGAEIFSVTDVFHFGKINPFAIYPPLIKILSRFHDALIDPRPLCGIACSAHMVCSETPKEVLKHQNHSGGDLEKKYATVSH